VIVIERDGRTIVIAGWRAWVIGAVAVVVMTAVLAALAFLVLGIAVKRGRISDNSHAGGRHRGVDGLGLPTA
jgi:hypothetical protein